MSSARIGLAAWAIIVAAASVAVAAEAPLPDAAAMRRDLAGPFRAAALPDPKKLDGELARAWLEMTCREVAGVRADLRAWEADARGKLLTTGKHDEHGIRPNTQVAVALAVVARWGPDEAMRQGALADLRAVLRFVASTHSAGPLVCTDGKKWRNQWQSALWAYQAGLGAWLAWDRLDDELRWLTAAMVCGEADRFLTMGPPFQIRRDTKAEENAWNSMVIALAANLFPDHPNAARWHEAAVRWQLSSFLTEADVRSDRVVDGRSLIDWKLGANLHADHTLENHDRVHPSYMGTMNQTLQQHLLYAWAGRKPPQALDYNAKEVYAHLKFFTHPDGRMHFPNGQDWELARVTPAVHAMVNVLFGDAEAAYLERVSLETTRRMQGRSKEGRTLQKQEYFFPSLPGIYASSYAQCVLLHATFGEGAVPATEAQYQASQRGVRHFEHGQFVAQRTEHGWASFAWGNRVMGLAIPFARDLLGSPYELGYVGTVEVEGGPRREYPAVEQVKVEAGQDRFIVSATLSRGGGAVGQSIVFASLPDGTCLYVERLVARRAVKLTRLETGAIGVINAPEWPYQAGPRKLAWEEGSAEIDGRQKAVAFDVPSRWVCIDDRWAHVAVGEASAWRYVPNEKVERGRREQMLTLAPAAPRAYEAGGVIARRGVVTLLGRTAAQAREAAGAATLEGEGPAAKVRAGRWTLVAELAATPPTFDLAVTAPAPARP